LSNKKQEAAKDSKPFDGLLKALFSEQSEEIISCLLPDSHRPEGVSNDKLNVELNRNTLSIDIGRHIVYEGEDVTFNLEAQSGSDDDLLPRMHEYALESAFCNAMWWKRALYLLSHHHLHVEEGCVRGRGGPATVSVLLITDYEKCYRRSACPSSAGNEGIW